MLKWREECATYLTHVCRHRCSRENPVKRWNIRSFQLTLWLSSAVDAYNWLKAPYISSFHQAFSALVMSTDISQVGVSFFLFLTFFIISSVHIFFLNYFKSSHSINENLAFRLTDCRFLYSNLKKNIIR